MSTNKKYGLILSDKTIQPKFQASRNVFGNDSDSDDDVKKPVLFKPNESRNRQAKLCQEKAMLEDPTVYQYDEIYDQVMIKKDKESTKKKIEKKPMYIENLIKTANKRKIENERRIERQIQKEREKEGDEYKDKEIFVTSAYKKKLEEIKLEEEKEKREEYLESIGDVTKQKDLGGFYRHLYEQKLGNDKNYAIKEQKDFDKTEIATTSIEDVGNADDAEKSKKRNYRKRKTSSENTAHLSDGELEDSEEEINRVNLDDIRMAKKHKKDDENIDADSDFSIDDESTDDESEEKSNVNVDQNIIENKPPTAESVEKTITETSTKDIGNEEKPIIFEEKLKIDIWKKRTVGAIFDEALKRYYERKAARGH